jgi:hypothetical protein
LLLAVIFITFALPYGSIKLHLHQSVGFQGIMDETGKVVLFGDTGIVGFENPLV